MDQPIRDSLHSLYDCFPVLGQFLHPSVVQGDTVCIELGVRLTSIICEVIIGADNHIVVINEVCSQTVSKSFSEAVIELETISLLGIHGIPGDGHGHHQLGLPEGPTGCDDVS